MKPDCKAYRAHFADLLDGSAIPEAEAHLSTCRDCQLEFSLLGRMLQELRAATEAPAPDTVQRAIDLMPKQPVRTARLVFGDLGLVRSSAAAEDFQLVYEEEGVRARLLYRALPEGWSVTGRVDGDIKHVEGVTGALELDEAGRFHFEVDDLRDSDVYVQAKFGFVKIPAPTKGTGNDAEPSP